MALKRTKLRDFIAKKNSPGARDFGWVHTTKTTNLIEILNQQKLLAIGCNVFKGEELCYLFVGRPAYKYRIDAPATYWMLPTVFVMRFQTNPKIKRIFPFDSGAFHHKVFPNYITEFDIKDFELGCDPQVIGRMLGLFYQDETAYYARRPVGMTEFKKEHDIGPLDMQIESLLTLYSSLVASDCDDRSAAIEIQVEENIPLRKEDCLGVVVPEEMIREPDIKAALKLLTPNVRTYPALPNDPVTFYTLVSAEVYRIYKKFGILK